MCVCMHVVCVCVCAYNDYEISQIDYYCGNQLLFQGITTVGYVVSYHKFLNHTHLTDISTGYFNRGKPLWILSEY